MKQKIKGVLGKAGRPGKAKKTPKLTKAVKVPKLPKLPKLGRAKDENKLSQALENLPRITNETVAAHREEMLSSARKFIYPLQHSRTRVVRISVSLFIVGLGLFIAYVLVSLYKLQSASTFIYGVTRVLPLPVAKAGNSWVSYESYLFELRHLTHYYETQQESDFSSDKSRSQLEEFRKRSLQQVIDDAYVKQLARQNDVSVGNREVDDAVAQLRQQNRLGASDQEFADVLKEFWGWTTDDFRRELKQQLLAQKVVAKLDTATAARAQDALARLQQPGADFAKVAAELSDDQASRPAGGDYGFLIDRNSRDLAPKVVDELFKLQPNQMSGIIDTGYSLEIVKVLSVSDDKLRAAHIQFNYKDIHSLIKPLADKQPPQRYIHV